jgi:hypothetical protein
VLLKVARKELNKSSLPGHNDVQRKNYKHGDNAIDKRTDDTNIRDIVHSTAEVTADTQWNHQEDSNDKSRQD